MQSHTFEFEGVPVGYLQGGHGQPLLLIHGSGPGASSVGNWKAVLPALAAHYEVYAMDLIGFGTSGRALQPPYFDYERWVRQADAMLGQIKGEAVGVLGHSLSASLVLTLASRQPKVKAVMTTSALGAAFPLHEGAVRTWTCPRSRQELVQTLSGLIHDTSMIDESYLQTREAVIFAPGYADYFDQMFSGDKQQYIDAAVLTPATLARIQQPVLMLHGKDDHAFPAASTQHIGEQLENADVVLLNHCAHSVAVERTGTFLALAVDFFDRQLHSVSR